MLTRIAPLSRCAEHSAREVYTHGYAERGVSVLAPGGLLGLRDDDWGAYFWEPSDPLVELAMDLVEKH